MGNLDFWVQAVDTNSDATIFKLNIDDGVKHNNSIDNVHEEEVKESESEHRFYYKLSTFK